MPNSDLLRVIVFNEPFKSGPDVNLAFTSARAHLTFPPESLHAWQTADQLLQVG